jgi:hypothetical protein
MKSPQYSLNQKVVINSTKELKTIQEIENIADVWVYYMSDNTSYGECQIYSDYETYLLVKNILIKAESKVTDILDIDKITTNMTKWYRERNK